MNVVWVLKAQVLDAGRMLSIVEPSQGGASWQKVVRPLEKNEHCSQGTLVSSGECELLIK